MGFKNVDRLSNMPDEVLSEILSLMPTKFAVRTSILSKRWRYKWTLVTSIDIDVLPFHGVVNCCAFVDRVLDLCKSNEIKLFRLRFSNLWVQESRMTKWINEALRRKVSEFEIQCGLLELPISFYTCKTLTKLRVENKCEEVFMDWQTPFNLPCVKTLDVVVFCKPSRNALKLIRGCPILESLSLQMVVWDEEEECRFDIVTLKHLKLKVLKWSNPKKVVLNVPNLEDLTIGGHWCSPFVMEDLSSLVSVTFSLGNSYLNLKSNNFGVELLKGIFRAKSLSFCVPYYGLPDAALPNLPNLKHLELTGGSNLKPIIIFQFLESCSELEHLSVEIQRSVFDETEQSCWIEPHSVPSCMLKNLSTMKYEISMGLIYDIQFLEYMLGNAEVLRKLTITWKSGSVEDETSLCGKLLKCQRASRYCEIHFDGNSFDSAASC